MTLRLARTLLIVVALLALAGGNVFASTLPACVYGSLYSYIGLNAAGGCTINDKTFSNFVDAFTEGQGSSNQTSPATPDDTKIYVTPQTGTNIGLYFDFHSTIDGVAYQQLLTLDIDYLVTVTGGTMNITTVYTAASGGLAATETGASLMAEKNLCEGGAFTPDSATGFATNNCNSPYTSVPGVTSESRFTFAKGSYWSSQSGTIPLPAQTVLGVSDYMSLYGGTQDNGLNTAIIYSMTNEFIQAPSGIPEPATFLLLGSALLGLGALRRKRV